MLNLKYNCKSFAVDMRINVTDTKIIAAIPDIIGTGNEITVIGTVVELIKEGTVWCPSLIQILGLTNNFLSFPVVIRPILPCPHIHHIQFPRNITHHHKLPIETIQGTLRLHQVPVWIGEIVSTAQQNITWKKEVPQAAVRDVIHTNGDHHLQQIRKNCKTSNAFLHVVFKLKLSSQLFFYFPLRFFYNYYWFMYWNIDVFKKMSVK